MLSAITTVFGSATPCKRAARFGVSPTMVCSCATRPDQVANNHQSRRNTNAGLQGRTRLGVTTAATKSSPARAARSASSSWACGLAEIHQNTVAHILRHEATEAAHGLSNALLINTRMTSRRSSGSIRADSAVEPTRSENITVTWRRSAVSRGDASVVAEVETTVLAEAVG